MGVGRVVGVGRLGGCGEDGGCGEVRWVWRRRERRIFTFMRL